jgi:iron complex outermembrane receptor protein
VTGLPEPRLSVINAGELSIKGVELEAAWTPVQGLLIDAQIGYLDAQYEEFADARFPGGSRAFQTPAFAPEWTVRIGGQYEAKPRHRRLPDLRRRRPPPVRNRAGGRQYDHQHQSGADLPHRGAVADSYWIADARIVWESPNRKYTLGLYGQNLFDEVYKTEGQEFSSIGNIRTVYYGQPMTYYVRAGVRF